MTIDSWLLLDKQPGITSSQATLAVKSMLKKCGVSDSKVGHAGTLDKFASGLLLVGIGQAVKTVEYAMNGAKVYEFTVTWGESRDTVDTEGKVIETSPHRPSKNEIQEVMRQFEGDIQQSPPQYSAIKIGGKRASELARKNVAFSIAPRTVTVFSLKLTNVTPDSASFLLKCSKGFYVRSLALDMAIKLNTCGYVSSLRRLSIGNFCVDDAISLDQLKFLVHNDSDLVHGCSSTKVILSRLLKPYMRPLASVLDGILVQEISGAEAQRLRMGQPISNKLGSSSVGSEVAVLHASQLVALCGSSDGLLLKPKRVFNYLTI
ncbi:tRNA pseudouridine(55) synthase TruB [Rickettsiales endosymbiont of Peranema trichophorum]|uniref:tRNA pseudouridine(55) synthase TruB n=1 Tax=Rickettsiales endosymbiont of Peranema trichophorum TaxID=2486577 RepID=UPI001023C2F2|nr:tRNA pseudouridine(55) synthase TruB [Rickettsiales endosymbiont of Peranema trichophorum]RZI46319.1 tRNA pseudouridine(55) synthase TruB [Rickettsiales endosymbiont of Peranema trichophorum]